MHFEIILRACVYACVTVQRQRSQYDVMLAPFRCDVDVINKKRQIVQRKRKKVVALKGL